MEGFFDKFESFGKFYGFGMVLNLNLLDDSFKENDSLYSIFNIERGFVSSFLKKIFEILMFAPFGYVLTPCN